MSHIPQRNEKDCLNCGTIVQGKYCQNCGQENVVPHETFWHMVKHFLYDITHFDSKFFDSIKYLSAETWLFTKGVYERPPGQLPEPCKKVCIYFSHFFLAFF